MNYLLFKLRKECLQHHRTELKVRERVFVRGPIFPQKIGNFYGSIRKHLRVPVFFIGGVSAPIIDNIIMIFGCVFVNNES